ncbi:MAG: hypothetical protein D6719_01050 [Candidatus Dadabacteria bacterium]|nr:MAG: hypothetical protein D6719_01050 [Candidatus Dadabacteria bacterium]
MNSCGFITISALLISGLIALLVAGEIFIIQKTIRIESTSIYSRRAKEEAKKAALVKFLTLPQSGNLLCSEDKRSRGKTKVSLRVCGKVKDIKTVSSALITPDQRASFPLFSIKEALKNTIKCDTLHNSPIKETIKGTLLNPLSLRTEKVCSYNTIKADKNYSSGQSLSINSLYVPQDTFNETVTVFSKGYIEINNLSVTSAVTVIAAGDLFIEHINALTPDVPVALISLSGEIVLKEFSGTPIFRIAAKEGVIIPSAALFSKNPYWPEEIDYFVASLHYN